MIEFAFHVIHPAISMRRRGDDGATGEVAAFVVSVSVQWNRKMSAMKE